MPEKTIGDPLQHLESIAGRLAFADCDPVDTEVLTEIASELAIIHNELNNNWVRLETTGGVPTVAQGVALARFLRPSLERRGLAHVCAGGAGLPADYLYVRFEDGYEGGIAPNGSTST